MGNPTSLRGAFNLNQTGLLYFQPISVSTAADNGTFRGAITGAGRVIIFDVAIGFDPADSTIVDADIQLFGYSARGCARHSPVRPADHRPGFDPRSLSPAQAPSHSPVRAIGSPQR